VLCCLSCTRRWSGDCDCDSSGDEAVRLASVVTSADVIEASSLPLQLNHQSASDASIHTSAVNKKHKRPLPSPLTDDVCETAGSSVCSDSASGDGKCPRVKEHGTSYKYHKHKHKRLSQVNESGSNRLDNASDRRRELSDLCSRTRKHKKLLT